jgi:hypothetical protein
MQFVADDLLSAGVRPVPSGQDVDAMRAAGESIPDPLLASLSPLGWEHYQSHRRLFVGSDAFGRCRRVPAHSVHPLIFLPYIRAPLMFRAPDGMT